ncbi:MarR family winged helix-turn-helix transcriptional regulator [Microbacterium karelineae]|uniref:MarR family winged helix-turn-helix transcriptional regulator n=1 Tax=Microbacterium karelineae TaxID=2654283 RepID=UPI0012EA8620|nr:MarR family transcriptional regulator [Microbacterium karelineae]
MTTVPGWTDGLPYALFRANQAVHRRLEEAIAGLDVTVTQLGIAVHLAELGHMSASDLARRFRITPQSASTALGSLESKGWVRRTPHPYHGRVIWYEVTDVGRTGVVEGRRRLAQLHESLREVLGEELMGAAIAQMHEVTEALDGPEIPSPTMWR